MGGEKTKKYFIFGAACGYQWYMCALNDIRHVEHGDTYDKISYLINMLTIIWLLDRESDKFDVNNSDLIKSENYNNYSYFMKNITDILYEVAKI